MDFKAHIKIKDLNVWYERHKTLNNISVEIPEKKITAIIVPSGCGKTTLLKALNRLIELQDNVRIEGNVIVDNEDIYSQKVEITQLRKKMGLLSQKPQVLPMSIYENVAYGPKIHGIKDKKLLAQIVEKYLKEAGLWNEVKNRIHGPASKLSIGQQQRLCLARGLAVEPEIILADEPTSALDPVSAKWIEEKFLELRNKYTVILVTHSLDQAKRIADYVIFLYMGNLIEYGPAAQIFRNPKYIKTKSYLDGRLIEDIKVDRELDLRRTTGNDIFAKAKYAMEELAIGQVLKVIIDHEQTGEELSRSLEHDGHKVLEVIRKSKTDREVFIKKQTATVYEI